MFLFKKILKTCVCRRRISFFKKLRSFRKSKSKSVNVSNSSSGVTNKSKKQAPPPPISIKNNNYTSIQSLPNDDNNNKITNKRQILTFFS